MKGRPWWTLVAAALVACGGSSSSSPSGTCSNSTAEVCPTEPGACDYTALTTPPPAGQCVMFFINPDCGGYVVVQDHGVDANTYFYYTPGSSQPVAVVSQVLQRRGCIAGPAHGFTEPSCAPEGFKQLCGP